ncbi:hypothetical protein ACFRAQ_28805 [Nocardia sp. NPDC056611]|uniref:hypothetical protein n=1 Tax=Nocardia sp. NPDC056611 TaxID=3345877 RepID=UPI00366F62FE
MSSEIAGRTFSTPEEAGIEPPTPQDLEEYGKMFKEARQKLRIASPDPEVLASNKFHDEISGTEFDPRNRKSADH